MGEAENPAEGWAERAAKKLVRKLSFAPEREWFAATLLPLLRQLEADEAALAMIPSVASHAQRMDALASLRALKRSLGVEE